MDYRLNWTPENALKSQRRQEKKEMVAREKKLLAAAFFYVQASERFEAINRELEKLQESKTKTD